LSTKVHLVKAMVFPGVMYGCESWTVKKAECRRIDAFELWCWKRLLSVPWTARRSNQSILKEISPGCSLEGLMLKLKLQYLGHLMQRIDSLEKTLWLVRTLSPSRTLDIIQCSQFNSVQSLSCVRLCDPIQPSHPLLSPSPPALNLSQQQGLFQ